MWLCGYAAVVRWRLLGPLRSADPRCGTSGGFTGSPRCCAPVAPPYKRFGGQPCQKQCPVPRLPRRGGAIRRIVGLKSYITIGKNCTHALLALSGGDVGRGKNKKDGDKLNLGKQTVIMETSYVPYPSGLFPWASRPKDPRGEPRAPHVH